MVYIYLPAVYYDLNLDIKERVCWQAEFSAVPAVFLVLQVFHVTAYKNYVLDFQI